MVSAPMALSGRRTPADIPGVRLRLGLLTVLSALMAAACGSTGAIPRPFPTPGATPPQAPGPVSQGSPPEGGRVSESSPPETRPPVSRAETRPPFDTYALTGTALGLRG